MESFVKRLIRLLYVDLVAKLQ